MYYHYVMHTYCMYLNSARTLIIMIQLVRNWLTLIKIICVFTLISFENYWLYVV